MNPPYSIKNWNRAGLKPSDPRFEIAGVLPPDSKGDFAFLLHGLYHLSTTGTMAIVLPHGILFRGSAEGEIRKRLLEKNQIDAVIGLPSNLFTNTGIPVCIIILKKNRELNEPVLFIDASRNFIKVGKQNVLQEKDIAKIVDVYKNRVEEKGYSHLASRQELIQNEFNMNIPRYVTAIDEEIPHDVEAHLYGGIPENNIKSLVALHQVDPELLGQALTEKRPGYFELNQSIEEFSEAVLSSPVVTEETVQVIASIQEYLEEYWAKLHQLNSDISPRQLREEMLAAIKDRLSEFKQLSIYDGYQIIAEIWTNYLSHDVELIEQLGFYKAGRTREPNMVTKGKNKEKVQDGWNGVIIPNELIASEFYGDELADIEGLKSRVSEIDSELSELVENAKVEDSDEYNALFDTLKKNDEGEAQDSFESKLVKASLKEAEKGSVDYELLKKVDDLTKEKSTVNKAIKTKELEMKELVAERIVQLTDAEVDQVLYKKWFGSVLDKIEELVKSPLKAEIAVLEELNNRYSETLDSLDDEISKLEKELEAMMKELFPAEGERVPKCRFPGFEGEWEEKKLGEVSEIYDGTHQTPRYTTDGIMFLSVENIKTLKSNKYISEADFEKDFKISPQNGDVLMTRIGDIGTSNVVNTDSKLAFYVSLALIRSTQLDSNFLNTSISSINFQKELWSRTLHIAFPKKINKNEIGEVSILFPSITEQQAIGNFFQKLDKSITLQQQKLDKLKDLKKAYLNELFV